MTTQALPDLDQLTDSYDIVGELAGRDDARTFLARRRDDGLDVLIVLAAPVAGDEGNALSHLAADANLLTSLQHRSLLPVLDGRWVKAGGNVESFALVLQRTNAPTLAELLNRRDEVFDYPRIAAILAETNGVLEWARDRKIVHRRVTPETLFVEPGTDRIHVSFAVAPLPANGVPGPHADGRTIAALARAMLTRSPADPERETRPLAELRPGLPLTLLDETERLLHPDPAAPAVDASGYVARIAMADALKRAEEHLEASRNAIELREREHRAQIEKERREHDAQIAAERKAHDEQIASERKAHEREMEAARREHERQVAEQAKQLQREREQHEREFAEQQREFEKRVAEQQRQFERQVAEQQRNFERQVAEQQKNFERQVTEQRKQFEHEVAERQKLLLEARGEHDRTVSQQLKQLQREREELQRQVAEERRRMAKEREQFDRELAKERQRFERELARERAALEHERQALAQLASQAELYAHTTELPAPARQEVEVEVPRRAETFVEREVPPPEAVVEEHEEDVEEHVEHDAEDDEEMVVPPFLASLDGVHDEIVEEPEADQDDSFASAAPPVEPPAALAPAFLDVPALDFSSTRAGKSSAPSANADARGPVTPGASRFPRWRSSWNVPAAAVALLLLIGVTALAIGRGKGHRAMNAVASASSSPDVVVDSAAGNVYQSVVPLPRIETDTGILAAKATDWTPPPRKRVSSSEQQTSRASQSETNATNGMTPVTPNSGIFTPPAPPNSAGAFDSAQVQRDTGARRRPASTTRRDSSTRDTATPPMLFTIPMPAAKRDTAPAPKPAVKPDTTPKRDSLQLR